MKSHFTPAEVNAGSGARCPVSGVRCPVSGVGCPVSGSGSSSDLDSHAASAPEALVVGAGFGGLAAAIRLSVMGYRVQVLEKLDGPGGRAYVRKPDGFSFDGGPTIITVPFMFEELWRLCGRSFTDDVDCA